MVGVVVLVVGIEIGSDTTVGVLTEGGVVSIETVGVVLVSVPDVGTTVVTESDDTGPVVVDVVVVVTGAVVVIPLELPIKLRN